MGKGVVVVMKALCIDGRPYLGLTTGEIYDVEIYLDEPLMYIVINNDNDTTYALKARFDVIIEEVECDGQPEPDT